MTVISSGLSAPSRRIVSSIGALTRAAHLVDGLFQRQATDFLAVDLGDQVTGQNASLFGGRVEHRRDHLDEFVLHRDLDAEAAIFTLCLGAHVRGILGVHEGGVRIERGQHAVDRVLDQLLVFGFLDIIGAHALEDVTEDRKLLVGVCAGRIRGHHEAVAGQDQHRGGAHQASGEQQR